MDILEKVQTYLETQERKLSDKGPKRSSLPPEIPPKALTHLYSYGAIWHLLKFIGKFSPFSLYVRIFKCSSMQFFEAMHCIFYICDDLWQRYFHYP